MLTSGFSLISTALVCGEYVYVAYVGRKNVSAFSRVKNRAALITAMSPTATPAFLQNAASETGRIN